MKNAIILDLDDTLIKSYEYSQEMLDNIMSLGCSYRIVEVFVLGKNKISIVKNIVCVRPGLRRFLDSCRKHFDYVCVWTAGTSQYAKGIVENFFPYKPYTTRHRKMVDTNKNGERYKCMNKLRNLLQSKTGEKIHITMIDDLEINCVNADFPYVIKAFDPFSDEEDKCLDILGSVIFKDL